MKVLRLLEWVSVEAGRRVVAGLGRCIRRCGRQVSLDPTWSLELGRPSFRVSRSDRGERMGSADGERKSETSEEALVPLDWTANPSDLRHLPLVRGPRWVVFVMSKERRKKFERAR